MSFNGIVIGSIVGVAIVAILISLFLYQIPGLEKAKFDNTCDQYFTMLVSKGSLTAVEQNNLRNKLDSMNFKNVSVSVVNGSWGNEVSLTVNATIELKQVRGKIENYDTQYYNSSTSLGLR